MRVNCSVIFKRLASQALVDWFPIGQLKRQQLPPAVRLARRQTADMKPFLARQRKAKPVSAVKASWLLFREQVHLQADEIAMRDRLLAAAPKLVTLDSLVKRFLQMTKQRTASLLTHGLTMSTSPTSDPLIRFANGLRNDYAAVSRMDFRYRGVKVKWKVRSIASSD